MKLTVQKQFSRNANSHRCEWSGRMLMSVRKAATDLYLCFFIMEIFCTNHQYIIYSLKKKHMNTWFITCQFQRMWDGLV